MSKRVLARVCACMCETKIWTDQTIKVSDLGSLICKEAVKVPGVSPSSSSLSLSLSLTLIPSLFSTIPKGG